MQTQGFNGRKTSLVHLERDGKLADSPPDEEGPRRENDDELARRIGCGSAQTVGMDFKCQGCGACCRIKDGIVRVGDAEIKRIAEFLGMSEQAFINTETEVAPDRKTLVLKSRPDESCVYLTDDNRCRIHPVKPDKCRTFPFEWANPDSAEVCPALKELRGGGIDLSTVDDV